MTALPSPLENTFLTGQPMLMSIKGKGASRGSDAALNIASGSEPKSCTAVSGAVPSSV